jgi:ubiquitin-protein ligase
MDVVSAVAPQAKKRVLKDIERVQQELASQGIWYEMDESNLTRGKALIRGPADTPYEGSLLLFSIQFPSDYPFSPPNVLFLTSDGRTRFHPNLYVEGKVCLSILGTYSGPSWSGTQSLSSVLLSILGLLDANPLSHEPAYERGTLENIRHKEYANWVDHQMVGLMIQTLQEFESGSPGHPWREFEEIVSEQIPSLKDALANKVFATRTDPVGVSNLVYGMGGTVQWKTFEQVPWIAERKPQN